jgi:hypothetical protein
MEAIEDDVYDEDLDGDCEGDFDCGMTPDGRCTKAGSEECDWDCPFSGDL